MNKDKENKLETSDESVNTMDESTDNFYKDFLARVNAKKKLIEEGMTPDGASDEPV